MTKELLVAWAAGVIDQGSIRIETPQPNHYCAILEVKQNHLATCQRLEEILVAGEAKEARTQREENKRPVFHWQCRTYRRNLESSKQDVMAVLLQIKPFLFTNAEQAKIAIDFCKTSTYAQEAEVYGAFTQLQDRLKRPTNRAKE